MKNIRIFLFENFHFLVIKFSVYLNRHAFVMAACCWELVAFLFIGLHHVRGVVCLVILLVSLVDYDLRLAPGADSELGGRFSGTTVDSKFHGKFRINLVTLGHFVIHLQCLCLDNKSIADTA